MHSLSFSTAPFQVIHQQAHLPRTSSGFRLILDIIARSPPHALVFVRTPSQNSEYRHRVAQHRLERRQQEKEAQHQAPPTNPIHVSGLPDPFRQTSSNPYVTTNNNNMNNPYSQASPPSHNTRPASVRSSDGRVRLSGAGTPQFPLSVSRLSQSSLTNLANVTNLHHNNHHSNSNNINNNNNNNNGLKRTDSARKSNVDPTEHHTFLENGSEESYQTPSPADSAVGDLEQVLREKEGEIVYLRDTLEQNEQVIFRVYEEKEKTWEREIRKIKVKAFESIPLFTVFFSTVPLHVNSHRSSSTIIYIFHLPGFVRDAA